MLLLVVSRTGMKGDPNADRHAGEGAKDFGLPGNGAVDGALRRRSPFPERTDRNPRNCGGPRLAMGSGGVAILPGVVAGGLLDYVAQHSDRLDAFILRTRRQNLS
jgi:hypothetical protein